jgi:hypothetical protein
LETDIPLSPGTEAVTLALVVEFFDAVADLCYWKSREESSQDDPAGDEEYLQHHKRQEWHSIADTGASFAPLNTA